MLSKYLSLKPSHRLRFFCKAILYEGSEKETWIIQKVTESLKTKLGFIEVPEKVR